jgi:hypothetical protein
MIRSGRAQVKSGVEVIPSGAGSFPNCLEIQRERGATIGRRRQPRSLALPAVLDRDDRSPPTCRATRHRMRPCRAQGWPLGTLRCSSAQPLSPKVVLPFQGRVSFSMNGQVNPNLGHNNARIDICVLAQQMEQIRAV